MSGIYEETGLKVIKSFFFTEVESSFYYDPQDIAFRQSSKFYLCAVEGDQLSNKTNTDTEDETEKPLWIRISSLHNDSFQEYAFQIFSLSEQE